MPTVASGHQGGGTDQGRPHPEVLRERPGRDLADRHGEDRAEHVVRVDPRQQVGRHVFLHGGVPRDRELLEREPDHEPGQQQDQHRRGQPEGEHQQHVTEAPEHAVEEQPPDPYPHRDERTDDHADGLHGQDQAPGGAPEARVGDHWAEHRDRARQRGVDHTEAGDHRPQPGAADERCPTEPHLTEDPRPVDRRRALRRGHPHQREQQAREKEGAGVDGQPPARPGGGDQHAADRGSGDHRGVERQPVDRVGLLEHP